MKLSSLTRIFLASAAVLLTAAAAVGIVKSGFRQTQRQSPEQSEVLSQPPTGSPVQSGQQDKPLPAVGRYLISGIDENNLTDTLIIAYCFFDEGRVELLSVPRDTYVGEVPTGKINAVYARAESPYRKRDMRNLKACIGNKLGIELDGWILGTMAGFRSAVDAMGGIPITLERGLYDAKTGELVLAKGEQILNGRAAEKFVCYRSGYVLGDLGRVEAQKKFLAAAFKKASGLESAQLAQIAAAQLANGFSSDMPIIELMEIVSFLKGVEISQVYCHTLPGVQFTSEQGYACYAVNKTELAELLNRHFYGFDRVTEADIAAPSPAGLDYSDSFGTHDADFAQLTER